MTQDEKEIAELLKTYHDQIVALVKENDVAIGRLDAVRAEFVRRGWFERHKEWILPILIPAAIVAIGIFAVSVTKSDIKIGDVTISKQQDCAVLPSINTKQDNNASSTTI